jgi:hypothetical protein
VNFLVKVATGKMKEVDDIREEEVLEEISKRQKLQYVNFNTHNKIGSELLYFCGVLLSKSVVVYVCV